MTENSGHGYSEGGEVPELAAKEGEVTLGVGDGSGNLFVHGSYESIKAAQAKIFELERLREENRKLKEDFGAFKKGIARGSELYAHLKFDNEPFTPYQLALQENEKLREALKELLPLAQNFSSTLRWDEEYSGDEVGGKEAQELVDRAKRLLTK